MQFLRAESTRYFRSRRARPLRGAPRQGRAVALIITLWVIVIMTIMAYSIMYESNLNVELTTRFRDRFYAMILARSGLGRASVDLLNDLRVDQAETERAKVVDAKGDPWARIDDEYVNADSHRRMQHGTFTVRVIDENRLYPINLANANALVKLLEVLGMKKKEDAENTAAAIVDYIDEDDIPSLKLSEDIGENRSYEKLIAEDQRLRRNERVVYVNKNDVLQTRDELLQVYGITPDLYYGSAWTLDRDPRLRWDRPRYYDRLDLPRDYRPGLRDLITIHGVGAMNLNTLRPEVAQALFSISTDSLSSGETAAKSLVEARPEYRRDRSPSNDGALTSFAELPQIGVDLAAANAARAGGVLLGRSTIFRIESEGEVRGVHYRVEALVSRDWDAIARDDSKLDRAGRQRQRDNRSRDADSQVDVRPALRALEWREF